MGGVNHQPCNRQGTRYLAISTLMSLCATSALVHINQANVQLENVILSEINDNEPNVGAYDQSLDQLKLAVTQIDTAIERVDELKAEMDQTNYQPLAAFATYGTIDKARALAQQLADAGLMQMSVFDDIIAPQIVSGNAFYAAVPVLRAGFEALKMTTVALLDKMTAVQDIAADAGIADMLETNTEGNFRADFMRLYEQTNRFMATFVASAAWSTEMWYHTMSVGSLTSEPIEQRKAG